MQLTRAADYAVRVMLHLAMQPVGPRASRAQLARWAEAPASFIAKILQQLVAASLLRSRAGRSGGFELARPAAEISLLQIVEAIDGPVCLNRCLPPENSCHRSAWCPAHPVWAEAQTELHRILGRASLESLVGSYAANVAAVRDPVAAPVAVPVAVLV